MEWETTKAALSGSRIQVSGMGSNLAVKVHEEGRRRKEPTAQDGAGWNPREPMGEPSGKVLENTEGDSADKMITCNCWCSVLDTM
jgi:hypothetical protein